MTHDGEHERRLERILVGELDENASETARALADCPECRDELTRLRALDRQLAGEAERQRADFELARSSTGPDEERKVLVSLEKALVLAAPRGRLRRWPAAWLAAAAVLVALLGWMAFRPTRQGDPVRQKEILLGGELTIRFDPATARLDWDGPDRATFEVEVRSVRDGRGDELLLPKKTVLEPTWSPSPEELALLPAQVFVKVTVDAHDFNGWIILSFASPSER